MGFEKTHLFGKVEVDVLAASTATLAFSTDVPGGALAQRFVFTIPVTTRTTIRSRLPGNMQGHLVQATCTPGAGQVQLYGVRLWTRELPDGQWGWFELPIVQTPVEYQAVGIPIPSTGQDYVPVPIPVEATPGEFSRSPIPVEPTLAEFREVKIPIEGTPESFNPVAIPVEGTPAEYSVLSLPVKPTPPVPQWVQVPVDE